MARLATKAVKAALLAISADRIGSEHEVIAAGALAGSLWFRAGGNLLDLHIALCDHGIERADTAWACIVDGWFDSHAAA